MNILSLLLHRPWFSKDRFETLSALVIVYLGLLLALIIYQQDRTDQIGELLNGQVIQQTMQATSTLAIGQFNADYGWKQAYRLWLETDILGYLTYIREDDALTAQYDAVRDKIRELSPLLQAPYFVNEDELPLIAAYESDTYLVDVTFQQQDLELKLVQAAAWSAVEEDYGLISRILTAGLLISGLMVTLIEKQSVQRFAFGVVVVLSIYATVQTAFVVVRPIPDRPRAAMQHLADGVGLYHQRDYEGAIAAFTEALELDPTYTEAYVKRGFAARDIFTETEDPALLAAATDDFEAAVEAGRSEVDVIGQLGELYYLQGQFADAQRVSQIGIESTSDFIHTFDLGRSLLASGDIPAAQQTYEQGMAQAIEAYNAATPELPLSSAFWRSLDIGALELDALVLCAEQQSCYGAAPYDSLSAPNEIAASARDVSTQLKSLSVSLELTGTPNTAPTTVTAGPLSFVASEDVTQDATTFIEGVREIQTSFDYQNVLPNATIVIKVFIDDREYPPLRQAATLEETPNGTYSFTLKPGVELGTYTVHAYIDGLWVQQSSFEIVAWE